MAIFNATDRKNIMDYIVSFAEQYEHILALIVVGSGSFGYIDELSDLDMVMAIDSNENMETAMEYVASQLSKRLSFIYFKQNMKVSLKRMIIIKNLPSVQTWYGIIQCILPLR